MPARFVFFHAIISIASTFPFFSPSFPFIPYCTAILRLTASSEFRLMPCSYTATIIVLLTHSISSSSCVCVFYRLITFFLLVTSLHRIAYTQGQKGDWYVKTQRKKAEAEQEREGDR